ncbi:MAG: NADH-quinone oxidoreductase subunit M, partial [Proteobacteria bacterium]
MMQSTFPLLSLAIWLPILFGLLVLAVGNDRNPGTARALSLFGSIASFLVTLPIVANFDNAFHGMQFVERASWISSFNIFYALGIDGISLWFVPLTALITVIVVIAGWQVIEKKVSQYMGAFLILSGAMIGVFCALDGLLFYVFFEATLIPMFIIIGVWGGSNRMYAAVKFFLYTFLGSLLMLVAI